MPGYATIAYYPHMAENCPTMAPDFFRPDGCWSQKIKQFNYKITYLSINYWYEKWIKYLKYILSLCDVLY